MGIEGVELQTGWIKKKHESFIALNYYVGVLKKKFFFQRQGIDLHFAYM